METRVVLRTLAQLASLQATLFAFGLTALWLVMTAAEAMDLDWPERFWPEPFLISAIAINAIALPPLVWFSLRPKA